MLLLLPAASAAHGLHESRGKWALDPDKGRVQAHLALFVVDIEDIADLEQPPLPKTGPEAEYEEVRRRLVLAMDSVISVTNAGERCPVAPGEFVPIQPGVKMSLGLLWECAQPLQDVRVEAGFLFRLAPDHRHLVRVRVGDEVSESVLTFEEPSFTAQFPSTAPEPSPAASDAPPDPLVSLLAGLRSTATGWGSALFLVVLLAIGGTLRFYAAALAAYTCSSGAALIAARLAPPELPEWLLAAAVGASIVVVAIQNFRVERGAPRWAMGLALGPVHGVALAAAAPAASLGWLVGGVALGQLAGAVLIACVVHRASARPWYRTRILLLGSALAGCGAIALPLLA